MRPSLSYGEVPGTDRHPKSKGGPSTIRGGMGLILKGSPRNRNRLLDMRSRPQSERPVAGRPPQPRRPIKGHRPACSSSPPLMQHRKGEPPTHQPKHQTTHRHPPPHPPTPPPQPIMNTNTPPKAGRGTPPTPPKNCPKTAANDPGPTLAGTCTGSFPFCPIGFHDEY